MHQKAPAIIALKTLHELACGLRPRDNELADAAFGFVMNELEMSEEFAEWKRIGEEKGIRHVESGPLVRSSYHAEKQVRAHEAV